MEVSTSGPGAGQAVSVGIAVAIIAGIAAAGASGVTLQSALDAVEAAVVAAGPAGPLIFIGAYAVAAVALIPASLLTLAAGYLFGPLAGTAVVSAASTLGAAAAFLIARSAARPLVAERLRTGAAAEKLAAIDAGIAEQGARVVFLLRLSPLVPYGLLNYGLGLTGVSFWPYVAASWAGMLPATFAYVYLGGAGRAALGAAGELQAGGGGVDGTKLALYVVGAAATLYATKIVSDVAGAALVKGKDGGPGEGPEK